MKEILQTKHFRHSFIPCICCLCIYSCTHAFYHVDTAAKELPLTEVEEPEAEYQKQPEPEYKVADQASEQDCTNYETQQGKPRCI